MNDFLQEKFILTVTKLMNILLINKDHQSTLAMKSVLKHGYVQSNACSTPVVDGNKLKNYIHIFKK